MIEMPPPSDIDAEASVLSALILSPENVAEVERVLSPADFYSDANRLVAEAVWAIDRNGERVDETTVASWLKSREKLQRIGGTPYLAQLLMATPAVAHVADHARIVAANARIRRVQASCSEIRAEGYAQIESVPAWLQSVEARVFRATEWRASEETMATLKQATADELDAMRERARIGGAIVGTPTQLTAVDKILGGLCDGLVYTLAARPGIGKTAAAMQVAMNVAEQDLGVVVCSLEMPRDQLVQRAIAQRAAVSFFCIRTGRMHSNDHNAVADAAAQMGRMPLVIDDQPSQTVHGIRSTVRRGLSTLRRECRDIRLGLVVVDYLQIMQGERKKGDSRETEVSEMMHGIAALAKEFRCPVLLLSQLNREVEKRADKRPQLSDLRESGAIEQDSYAVIFLYRDDYYRAHDATKDGSAEFIVAKNRNGAVGTATIMFDERTVRFWEKEKVDPAEDDYGIHDNTIDDSDRRHP